MRSEEEEDLRKGNLFATGLVAGGALAGVIVAFLSVNESISARLAQINVEEALQVIGHKWIFPFWCTCLSFHGLYAIQGWFPQELGPINYWVSRWKNHND